MTPDATYEERRISKEAEKLNTMVKHLSDVEKEDIYKQGLLSNNWKLFSFLITKCTQKSWKIFILN